MSMNDMAVKERAADKLRSELAEIDKIKPKDARDYENVKLKVLGSPVCEMLTRFVFQEERFAEAIDASDKTLMDCLKEAGKSITAQNPNVDGMVIYAAAVQFYLPGSKIRCSFRIDLPLEEDDDLFDVNAVADQPKESKGAIVLDLFDTGEV